MKTYENAAKTFCEAIADIAKKPANLDNLESYLTRHFEMWLEKWGNTPENIADDLKHFADMEV
jgi:hypothetical protein